MGDRQAVGSGLLPVSTLRYALRQRARCAEVHFCFTAPSDDLFRERNAYARDVMADVEGRKNEGPR